MEKFPYDYPFGYNSGGGSTPSYKKEKASYPKGTLIKANQVNYQEEENDHHLQDPTNHQVTGSNNNNRATVIKEREVKIRKIINLLLDAADMFDPELVRLGLSTEERFTFKQRWVESQYKAVEDDADLSKAIKKWEEYIETGVPLAAQGEIITTNEIYSESKKR